MTDNTTLAGGEQPVMPEGEKALETPEAAAPEPEAKEGEAITEAAAEEKADAPVESKDKKQTTREFIKGLQTKVHDKDERIVALEKQIAALEKSRPKEGDYSDPAEFDRANLRHAVKEARADELKAERDATAEEALADKAAIWQAQVSEARENYPDFDAVALRADLPISREMGDIIAESHRGAEMAYYLGKNPDEAKRISQLPPLKAARELGRLEAELTPKPRKISNAPPPVQTVTASGGGKTADLSKLGYDDYRKAMGYD